MPKEIIESLINGDLVLFAGAGISTESKTIFKETLYDDILSQLDLSYEDDISFPDLMSSFCDNRVNGKQKLLEQIKRRFDYCHQFKELYHSASRFHNLVSPLWMLENIITTNWDDSFERECDAIPIVTPEDFAFYNLPQRKVFKIHGSISNYGSIVATNEDYEKCYKRLNEGLVGASLKTLLATKTILFVGYSFRDYDFIRIIEYLKREMKDVFPHIYIVTLDDEKPMSLNDFKGTLIKTSGHYFFKIINEHLEKSGLILPNKNLYRIGEVNYRRHQYHTELADYFLDQKKTSSIIYCLMYQDGIRHAIDYIDFKSKSGESYNPDSLIKQLVIYEEDIKKRMIKAKNYMDLAYVNGYIEGLKIPLIYDDENMEDFPYFFIYGKGPISDKKLAYEIFEENLIFHKTAEKLGNKYFSDYLDKESDVVPDHRPFL